MDNVNIIKVIYFSFRLWMLSGPETTILLLFQFKGHYLTNTDSDTDDRTNHETGLSSQKTFMNQVNKLVDVMQKMGNLFLDNFPELVTLDSRDCKHDAVAIINLEELGKTQRLFSRTKQQRLETPLRKTSSSFSVNSHNATRPNSQRPSLFYRTMSRYSANCT